MTETRTTSGRSGSWLWLLIMSILYAGFFVLRYGGLWIENDTAVFSRQAAEFITHGSIFYPGLYNHGFAYASWLGSLSLITGVNPATFNTVIMPFMGFILLVIPAHLAFSVLLRSKHLAVLGAIILVSIPDVAFSALRGTHEKLSMAFVCMGVFCLIKAFEAFAQDRRRLVVWLVLYFLVEFLNATTNDYFAFTFTFAITLTLVLGVIGIKLFRFEVKDRLPNLLARLGWVVTATWAILFGVMFFVFPPEAHDVGLAYGAIKSLTHLFYTLHASSNPYVQATSQWSNPVVFQIMNISRWLVVLASAAVWGLNMYKLLWRKEGLVVKRLVLISVYSAFAFLVCASIPLDFSGLAAGSNLEVRNFTYVVLFGVPLMAEGIYELTQLSWLKSKPRRDWMVKITRPVVVGLMSGLMLLGFLNVTLDPLVSNSWIFYKADEAQAIRFFWGHNKKQTLWTGPDDRLAYYAYARLIRDPRHNTVIGYTPTMFTKEFLFSPAVVASDLAQHVREFNYHANNLIYDNGGARIYRVRPQSPFMR